MAAIMDEKDASEKLSTLADWGLQLTFSRDLSPKFTRDNREDLSFKRLRDQPKNVWQVIGSNDFLEIEEFKLLESLEPTRIKDEDCFIPWRTASGLIVVPFGHSIPEGDFVQMVTEPSSFDCNINPLLVVTKITLSPLFFEYANNPRTAIKSLSLAIRHLQEALPRGNDAVPTFCFGSLSGPDIVVLSLPRNAGQLKIVQSMVRKARTLRLVDILERRGAEEENGRFAKEWPGHACVSVDPTLAFRREAKSVFESDEYRNQEEDLKFRLIFRLRLDCGHEDRVISDIKGKNREVYWLRNDNDDKPDGKYQRTTWGNYSVEGYFKHMSDFFDVWERMWFPGINGKGEGVILEWREQHLLFSITDVSLEDARPDPVDGSHKFRVWRLTQKFMESLEAIHEEFKAFARELLSPSQGQELLRIYASFCTCFFRHELLGTARDLYPFFKQLGKAFSLLDSWKAYLNESVENWIEFNDQVDHLLLHASRAVRNRIEHRSMQSDPPVPYTVVHGACRLVNSYSVIFWLAAELFRLPPNQEVRVSGDCRHFAASVCAGVSGYITCQELFQGFRESLEKEKERRLSEQGSGWSSRLLSLDISGRSLLRPELCFVHCLHEMAELSEWISLDRCDKLRRILNDWVLNEFARAFNYSLAKSACTQDGSAAAQDGVDLAGNPAFEQRRTELKRFSTAYVDAMIKDSYKKKKFPKNLTQVHPVELGQVLCNSLEEFSGKHSDAIKAVEENFDKPIPVGAAQSPEAARSSDFLDAVSNVRELVNEVLADCGLVCALDWILGEGKPRNHADRFKDICRVFKSLLVAGKESSGEGRDRRRLEQLIIHRWAIQIAALDPDNPVWRESLKAEIRDFCKEQAEVFSSKQLQKYVEDTDKFRVQFRKTDGLVTRLHDLVPYGGTQPGPMFPKESSFTEGDREVFEAFRTAWKKPNTAERLDFIFLLWAQSGRFGVGRVFESILDAPKDPVPVV